MMVVDIEYGRISRITINRPHARNAMNKEVLAQLIAGFQKLSADRAVEIIILTAAGEKAFCAGADLEEVANIDDVENAQAYFMKYVELIRIIRHTPQPVIGAVFGYVLAGGMGLAAAVDILVAADSSQFGLPEVRVGLFPMVVMRPIAEIIGVRRTLELSLSGERVSAHVMKEWGFINRMVSFERVHQTVQEYAQHLILGSPTAIRMGKEALWRIQELDESSALAYLAQMSGDLSQREDAREGIQAFRDKRPPQWPSRK